MGKSRFAKRIHLYTTALDSGFNLSQISLVWKLAVIADIDDPTVLLWSLPTINKAITAVISKSTANGTMNSKRTKDLLERLYAYRTKIDLDPPLKAGLKSTSMIRVGQRLRLVLQGFGIFTSTVVYNGGTLVVSYPKPVKQQYRCFDWAKKKVSVYFWRKNDAGYVFDTVVHSVGHQNGMPVISFEHTSNLQRSQKRKSIRCPCSIGAELFLLPNAARNIYSFDAEHGIKCLIEDLSEDGALVRIGGKGSSGMGIKLQFMLGTTKIVMIGTVRSIEYNETMKQSRLHFQCDKIDDTMQQTIAMYVYSVIPEEQQQAFDAISLIEEDEKNNDSGEEEEIEELEEVED